MTINREDYIKAIYELGGNLKEVSNKNIAETLKISPPSVSEMIKKLLNEGFVEYKLYQGVKLTEYGIDQAMKIRRRHLLWEVFLVEKLGYTWDEIDVEAEKLEHVTNDKLEERLDKYLNYPKICPHGAPIIQNQDEIHEYRTLDLLELNEEARIQRIADKKKVLQYANKINLKIGDKIQVIAWDENKDIIIIEKEEKQEKVPQEIAKQIYIR